MATKTRDTAPRRALTATSYIVLGLLDLAGPSTPYDLKQMVAGSVGNLWSIPHSQLYAEPQRLATDGLVRERRENKGRRRRTFELTAAGRRAVAEWRSQTTTDLPELRDPALLKVFFGADPQAIAADQVREHERKLAEYEERRAEMGATPDPLGPALTLDAGIAHERVWVDYWRRLAG